MRLPNLLSCQVENALPHHSKILNVNYVLKVLHWPGMRDKPQGRPQQIADCLS